MAQREILSNGNSASIASNDAICDRVQATYFDTLRGAGSFREARSAVGASKILASAEVFGTVAEAVAAPGTVPAVNVVPAVPSDAVDPLVGFTDPRVAPNEIGVPVGTTCPVAPFESVLMAEDIEEVCETRIVPGLAPILRTSQGLKLTVPVEVKTVSQGVALGPALHPHQFSVAATVALELHRPEPSPAWLPAMRELEMLNGPEL